MTCFRVQVFSCEQRIANSVKHFTTKTRRALRYTKTWLMCFRVSVFRCFRYLGKAYSKQRTAFSPIEVFSCLGVFVRIANSEKHFTTKTRMALRYTKTWLMCFRVSVFRCFRYLGKAYSKQRTAFSPIEVFSCLGVFVRIANSVKHFTTKTGRALRYTKT